ncbi:hypothetical protein GRS48_04310 [Halorubrum sp. JWXQ-INN 858]|uniref:hypothetical protein n=1 Tax=Halorubrum sp. JWXQ-INN 858 TaxID=2690782 RepID=UPI00135868F7|nr:hypothetical protein [Halorubrum sp. JWXQ-INN 858]MWV64049.1 hypothetical protein [Halorubrum sp. JWXQ-INN 858]
MSDQLITENEVQQIEQDADIGLDYHNHGELVEIQGWSEVPLSIHPKSGATDGQAEAYVTYQEDSVKKEKGGVVELRWYHRTDDGYLDSDNFDVLSESEIADIGSVKTVIEQLLDEVDSS